MEKKIQLKDYKILVRNCGHTIDDSFKSPEPRFKKEMVTSFNNTRRLDTEGNT